MTVARGYGAWDGAHLCSHAGLAIAGISVHEHLGDLVRSGVSVLVGMLKIMVAVNNYGWTCGHVHVP